MSSSPAGTALDKESEIDVEWERFAQNGCPDWWLMAKYTSGWLSSRLPYMAFKERSTGSTSRAQSSPEVELQQAAEKAAEKQESSRTWRSQSLDCPQAHSTVESVAAPASAEPEAGTQQVTTESASTPSAVTAAPVAAVRPGHGGTLPGRAGDAASQPLHPPGCAPLKGLFACQCTPGSHIERSIDQTAS